MFRFLILLASSVLLHAQNQLDANLTLFSVMTAYTVANDAPASPTPFQSAVRQQVESSKPAVMSELRNYFASHRKSPASADLAQYVSFALTVSEPPEFKQRFQGADVPPDVQGLEGFRELMERFYRDASIQELWQKSQPHIDSVLERYQAPVAQSVLEVNAYLRNPTSGYMGRRFYVVVDPLGPASQVHTRSYQDDYYVVVPVAAEPRVDEIRHGYLHYLVDPLLIKFSEKVNKSRGLIDYAQGSPLLTDEYKSDYLLLATESLIRAIESRLLRSPVKAVQALQEGFVVAPFFAEQLPLYEKQESAMRLYFPDMMGAMDFRKEERRLANVTFASAKTEPSVPRSTEASAAETPIERADKLYANRELSAAREAFLKILREGGEPGVHARAYFGLARVATLERNPELAEQLFRKTLEAGPDAYTQAWAEVYLGRLAEAAGEMAAALQHHRAALAVKGIPEGAKRAAEEALQRTSKEK